jgi:antitoxin HigA-1
MMYNQPHPGMIIRELCLKPLGLSVSGAARALGVSRKALSELILQQLKISSPDLPAVYIVSGLL